MRDYTRIENYLNHLAQDVYEQPEDTGHQQLAEEVIQWALKTVWPANVLDVGCGTGFCEIFFEECRIQYNGICMGQDVETARKLGHNVKEMDFSFLTYDSDSFHMVFARHALEHSPMPVLTLLEWHRVATNWLCLVMPSPSNYTFVGQNHYSVAWPTQIVWWLRRAGWKLKRAKLFHEEFWFLCEKKPIVGYEGWAKSPINHKIYAFERDKLKINGEEIDAEKHMGGAE